MPKNELAELQHYTHDISRIGDLMPKATNEVHMKWIDRVESEDKKETVAGIRATLMVNYGKNGRAIKGLISENDSTEKQLITVLEHYHKIVYPESYNKNPKND